MKTHAYLASILARGALGEGPTSPLGIIATHMQNNNGVWAVDWVIGAVRNYSDGLDMAVESRRKGDYATLVDRWKQVSKAVERLRGDSPKHPLIPTLDVVVRKTRPGNRSVRMAAKAAMLHRLLLSIE